MVANALADAVPHAALCAALYCTEHNQTELLAVGGRLACNERGRRQRGIQTVQRVARGWIDRRYALAARLQRCAGALEPPVCLSAPALFGCHAHIPVVLPHPGRPAAPSISDSAPAGAR